MLDDGATFIDVGAYSSKPNADEVSQEEELLRILPTLKLLVTFKCNLGLGFSNT